MNDDTPKEMSLEVKWADNQRAQLVVVHCDRVLHSDYCDPRSVVSRKKAIDTLLAKFPTMDREEVENELLQLVRSGPPQEEARVLSAVEPNPEPCPEEVDGAQLLDELAALLRRFLILPAYAAEVCALWILHTYVFLCFEYSPRLLVNSPDKRCGKSRLMRMLHALCARALSCESITAAALFRTIEAYRPTLFLDEADTYLGGRHVNEDLRGVLNSGHHRDGKVLRCIGDNAEPTAFSSFSPVAIAMIGKPPGTVEDRSIPIPMRRKMTGERVEKFKPGQSMRAQFVEYTQKCVRWATDNRDALSLAQPDVPSGIDDRAADSWFALLAIADQAGGRWPLLARQAAVAVMGGRDGADSIGVQLLTDLHRVFVAADADRMSSAGIVAELAKYEDSPWPEYRNERPITASQLAKLLKPFEVAPRTIRLTDGSTPKGYYKADFEEAWSRYVTPASEVPPAVAATPPHTCDDKDLRQSGAATPEQPVAAENSHNPLSNKACGGVAPAAGGDVQDRRVDDGSVEVARLVDSMAEEIDAVGGLAPFQGAELRQFYEQLVHEDGVVAALTDARARYQQQLLGEVLPLRRVGQ